MQSASAHARGVLDKILEGRGSAFSQSRASLDHFSAEIGKIKGVREAYHIHLWTITSGVYALSAHVLIDDQLVSGSRDILDEIRSLLSEKFEVLHSTIQLECEKCDMGPVCSLPVDVQKNR